MTSLTGAYVTLPDLIALADQSHARTPNVRGFGLHAGTYRARSRGRGIDLDEVRLYQPGDDVRYIDWKVTARKQKPHTKIFHEERERPTLIVVDQTQSMFFGSRKRLKSVAAAEVAARIAWQTLASRDRVGGFVIGNDGYRLVKPFRSSKTVAQLLQIIANFNQRLVPGFRHQTTGQDLWVDSVKRVQRIATINHRIFYISDFAKISEEAMDRLVALQRHNQLRLVFLYDEVERTLPPADTYTVSDGVAKLNFNSYSKRNRDTYRERFDSRVSALTKRCGAHGISFLSYSTSDSLESIPFNE